MGRGRHDPDSRCIGDVVDCWRVEAIESNHFLRLVAGINLLGRAYWCSVLPLHHFVFIDVLQGVAASIGDHRAYA